MLSIDTETDCDKIVLINAVWAWVRTWSKEPLIPMSTRSLNRCYADIDA
jgi:hypothetical protein